jgi:hypothetical protein
MSGQATVDLRESSAVNTRINLVPPRDISGQVVFDGAPVLVRIGLRSTVASAMDIAQQSVSSAGAFMLRNVTASDYVFSISLGGDKSYVKSIQLGNVDLVEEGLRAPVSPMEKSGLSSVTMQEHFAATRSTTMARRCRTSRLS